jgi:hypothetical protein
MVECSPVGSGEGAGAGKCIKTIELVKKIIYPAQTNAEDHRPLEIRDAEARNATNDEPSFNRTRVREAPGA